MVLVGFVAANAVGVAIGVVFGPPTYLVLRLLQGRHAIPARQDRWAPAPVTVPTRRGRPTIVPLRSFVL